MKHLVIVFLISQLLLSGCSQSGMKEIELEEKNIDKVYRTMTLAYKTYDIKLIENIYTDGAYTIYCGDTSNISNERKKLLAGFQRSFDYHSDKGINLDMKFKFIERRIDTEMAYDIGYYRIDKVDKQGVGTIGRPGKFVTVLLKQKDGSWKFQVDMYGDAFNVIFQ